MVLQGLSGDTSLYKKPSRCLSASYLKWQTCSSNCCLHTNRVDVLKSFGWMDKGLVIPPCSLSVSALIYTVGDSWVLENDWQHACWRWKVLYRLQIRGGIINAAQTWRNVLRNWIGLLSGGYWTRNATISLKISKWEWCTYKVFAANCVKFFFSNWGEGDFTFLCFSSVFIGSENILEKSVIFCWDWSG